MFKLGLTGSIGMGKSTTAQMFADHGCAVWDADATVHKLYSQGGAAVEVFKGAFPSTVIDGAVSRAALKKMIEDDPKTLISIERIVHPLVRQDREAFLTNSDSSVVVLDIPLLFETKSEHNFDAVACVFVSEIEQRRRVIDRGTMSAVQFEVILAKQMPIEEKLKLADYRIETDSLDHARSQVTAILEDIESKQRHA
ncbi:MAG: dephospho-CoA kinase [Paracoccaceae bacterium]